MFFYIIIFSIGLLPSLAWLLFYLREDPHPEPPKWLGVVFFIGVGAAPVSFYIEKAIIFAANRLTQIPIKELSENILFMFLGVALVEELAKFAGVRLALAKNPVLDEPTDAMIYMITAALGFAGLENVLVLNTYAQRGAFETAAQALILRFAGANFLHALASGIIGFYWALALSENQKNIKTVRRRRAGLLLFGIAAATILHGTFNLFIIVLGPLYLFYTTLLLFVIGLIILHDFEILKKLKSLAS